MDLSDKLVFLIVLILATLFRETDDVFCGGKELFLKNSIIHYSLESHGLKIKTRMTTTKVPFHPISPHSH